MFYEIYSSMVRIRMSTRLYPSRVGAIQTTGVRVRYPLPWTKVSSKTHKNWKLVVQEIEQPRLKQVLKAKKDDAVCILLGYCVG